MDPKPTDLESPYAAMRNNPVRHYDILGDTLGPDNNNYMMDYQPVFSAPSVGEGVLNFFGNLGTLLYKSTAGLAMTTAQTLGNITVGMINGTYKSPGSPMALFDQWQTEAYRYHTQTPLRQQVADFFAVATDPPSYEVLPAMALGLRLPRAPSVPMQSLKSGGQFKGSSLRPTETKGVDIVGTGFNKVLPTQDYINPLKVAE